MRDRILSPILFAGYFVGELEPHKTQEGKLWLRCAEYGFSFCVAEIHESFKPLNHGDVVRIEASLTQHYGFRPYPLNKAPGISSCAERMLGELFGVDVFDEEWDDAVRTHIDLLGFDSANEDVETFIPGDLYYRVVRV